MALPTLTQLAKGQAKFIRYQDGKLWYRIVWFEDTGPEHFEVRNFDFPIPVDMPEIYEVIIDCVDTLKTRFKADDVAQPYKNTANILCKALEFMVTEAQSNGAGGGEFLPEDKGIRFMRWARRHLDLLKEGAQKLQSD